MFEFPIVIGLISVSTWVQRNLVCKGPLVFGPWVPVNATGNSQNEKVCQLSILNNIYCSSYKLSILNILVFTQSNMNNQIPNNLNLPNNLYLQT